MSKAKSTTTTSMKSRNKPTSRKSLAPPNISRSRITDKDLSAAIYRDPKRKTTTPLPEEETVVNGHVAAKVYGGKYYVRLWKGRLWDCHLDKVDVGGKHDTLNDHFRLTPTDRTAYTYYVAYCQTQSPNCLKQARRNMA